MAGVRACVFCACERLYTHEHARRMRACVHIWEEERARESVWESERDYIHVREKEKEREIARGSARGESIATAILENAREPAGDTNLSTGSWKFFIYSSCCYRRSPVFTTCRTSLCILERNRFLVRLHCVNIYLQRWWFVKQLLSFFLGTERQRWFSSLRRLATFASTLHCKFRYEAFALRVT